MKTSLLLISLLGFSSFAVSAGEYDMKMCTAYGKIVHDVAQMRFANNATKQQALDAIQAAMSGSKLKTAHRSGASKFATTVVKRVYSLKNIAPNIMARSEKLSCLKIRARA